VRTRGRAFQLYLPSAICHTATQQGIIDTKKKSSFNEALQDAIYLRDGCLVVKGVISLGIVVLKARSYRA
jgi:hypothetical protein